MSQNIDGLNINGKIDVFSKDSGSRPYPSMTQAERDSIVSPATGSCVYNTTKNLLNIYNGTDWKSAGGDGGISDWLTGTDYIVGNVVIESDKIYQSLSIHTSGVFATDLANGDWKEISSYEKGIDSWVTAKVYNLGDVVIDSDKIYKALSVHTSGVFDTDLTNALWTEVSKGGGSSGGINYILNPEADTNINGWTTYKDAAGADPVDGTGGTSTFTYARSTSTPLRGAASFLLTKPASNVQGEGFSYTFTIDNADKGKVLQGSFDYQIASGVFVDDAMTVWIYDVTNARMIQPAPTKLKNSGIIEKFPFEFQTSIDSNSYRLIIHQSSTSAVASTIKFDNFKVGPTAKAYGSAMTDWVSYTPTWGSSGTAPTLGNADISGKWRRVGDSMEVAINFLFGSTSNKGTGTYTMSLPSGFAIDTSKLPNVPAISILGVGHYLAQSGYQNTQVQSIIYNSSTTVLAITDQNSTNNQFSSTQSTVFVNANDNWELNFKVPILGWSSSQVMSSDADTRVVAFSAKGTNSTSTSVVPVNFSTVTLDTHSGVSGNSYVVKVPGIYKIELSDSTFTSSPDASNRHIYIGVDGVTIKHVYESTGYGAHTSASVLINLKAGQTITGSVHAQDQTSIHDTEITIERLSGPSQIAASESVSCLYTGAPPTGTLGATENVVKYGTKVKDSHGAYNPSTGEYKVPVSGVYSISASFMIIDGTTSAVLYDGIFIYVGGVKVAAKIIYNTNLTLSIHVDSIPILQGAVVHITSFSSRTGAPYFANYIGVSHFSITRAGNF